MTTIYLWSILDSVKAAGVIVSLVLAILLLITGLACLEGDEDQQKQLKRIPIKSMLFLFFAASLCAVFVPSSDGLFRARLLSEASKVTTVENAAKLADEIFKRIDKALENR